MELEIISTYCLCDDFLKAIAWHDDPQATMSTAEVMTSAIIAAKYFGGHMEKGCAFLHEHGYIPHMLSKSQFNRRLHAIPEWVWQELFRLLAAVFKEANRHQEYVVDSFPVPVCDNIRIERCHIYDDEAYRGYCASKRRYFYGLRVHMIISASGAPIELLLAPGSEPDVNVVKGFHFDLPPGAKIYGDKAFNDYQFEEDLQQMFGVLLQPLRKKNSLRPTDPYLKIWHQRVRHGIETTFSLITNFFPKVIHAVTAKGFELKVFLFALAFAIQCL